MDEVELILEEAQEGMEKAIAHLKKQLSNIRAGKANPGMLGSVMVEYYGSQTPLNQVANVNTPDARTLSIQPFEKSLIPEIEKGILQANLGFNPMNNGESVIINVPPLTEERRKQLVKQTKAEGEDAKVGVRNDRKAANQELKKLEEISEDQLKDAEGEVQELTDKFIARIDEILVVKEKEIMTV
ncbi:MAG: ribosome recycling factor [Bacteroidota bacterium]|uniref:Ribosome-recycling factor n=1 Tax=Christiangramia flava JLT2011 TaxID=1229726 RepID=A0A1L7I5T8_9FLAO|nr:ribosome recycling factor [Christiangramia flava]APU68594.1 Ribosome recycling factor [Christiangramia flava JLT2011]MAM18310.1 ribosome recycling factor [Christiangramia sp.]MEE2770727.1 ribosome recycling factor [Bacteroidota bacterium]OSS40619.1 Ribosome recycling factor [Christiangramia flava JLT2011]